MGLSLIYHFRCRWCFFREVPRSPQSPNESFDPTPITLGGKPPPSPIVGCLHGNSLESSWRWIFRTHAIGQVHCRGSQVVDHQHSTSSLLPPRECLPFVHARMDRRRLNAELHRSLHWTRILWFIRR